MGVTRGNIIRIKKNSYILITLLLFFCVSLVFIGGSHAFSPSILYFSTIHITNTQNVSTPQPFQQMINLTINSTNSKYINQTGKYSFQNVEFFNVTNGEIIDSWLENYTSKYAIFWIKLPDGIPANTTINDIAIGFALPNISLFNNTNDGESAQLASPTYDDGPNVFDFYANFMGSSIVESSPYLTTNSTVNPSYTAGTSSSLGYVTTLADQGGASSYLEWSNGPSSLQNGLIMEVSSYYGSPESYNPADQQILGALASSDPQEIGQNFISCGGSGQPADTGIAWSADPYCTSAFIEYDGSATTTTSYKLPNNNYIYYEFYILPKSQQLYLTSSSQPFEFPQFTGLSNVFNAAYSISPSGDITYVGDNSGGSSHTARYYWIIIRNYPPNMVMPSITIGPIENLTYILSLNGAIDSNSTIIYGKESNFTAFSHNSSVFVRLFINNTKVTNYSKNSTTYTNILAAGLYKVTAQYNSTAVENITYYERINKAIPSIKLYSLPSKNYTQNGTYLRFNFSISSLNNQLTGRFYLNKTNKVNTSTATDYNVSNLPNTYIAVFNTTGNQNYTINSMNLTRRIYPVSLYLNGVLNSNSTITYGTESNFTADLPLEYVRLFINNTKVTNYSKNSTSYLRYLAAGLYEITANTNLSGGENVSFYERINKAIPSLSIESSTGNFTYDGDPFNLTGVISTSYNQLSANEYINGKLFASTNTRKSYLNATAGTYKLIFNTTGNQNYTSYSTSKEIVISKASPGYTLSGQSFTYDGKTTNISSIVSTVNNQLSATLYINGAVFSSFTTDSSIYKNATAGSYSAEVSSNGNENYSSFSYSETFIISKAEPTMECTDSPLVFLYNGSYFNLACNLSSINNQLSGNLYLNNLIINSSKSRVSYRNNKVGEYTFVFKAGNENYSEKEINISNSILGNLSFSLPLIKHYFPIMISNYQFVSTPQPFQQMINLTINSSNRKYINETGYYAFQNVEFLNTTSGKVINSWLEEYNSKYAIFWIKLPDGIPANTTINDIAIGFASNTTNLFNDNTTGEAPQLSSTYGEYDNGANIFNNYFNAEYPTSDFSVQSGYSLSIVTASCTVTSYCHSNPVYYIKSTGTGSRAFDVVYNKEMPDKAMIILGSNINTSLTNEGIVSLGTASMSSSPPGIDYATTNGSSLEVTWLEDGSFSGSPVINAKSTPFLGIELYYVPGNSSVTSYLQGTSESLSYTNVIPSSYSSGLYMGIASATEYVTELDYTSWMASASYPPNGIMPSVEFGNEINVPNLFMDNMVGNVSKVYGNKLNIIANDSNSNYIRLLINNKAITSYHKNSSAYSNYVPAGLDKITAEENLSNSSNYINVTYYENISKRVISQSLTVSPNNSFYYNGIAPVITDTLNESLVSGNTINYSLLNGSTFITYLLSKNTSTNFSSIPGRYASAGTYLFKVSSAGNENYTITNVPKITVNINKALPRLSIYTTPSVNYSNNGTSLIFHFRISSVNNQLYGNFYINKTIKNLSIVNGTYNASDQPNIFIAKLNTSGNENYTSNSIQKTMEIKLGKLYLYLNGFQSNLTVTYPQPLNVSAYSIPSTLPIKLYINNTLTASSNGSLHYLKYMAAGLYKITVATNSSGIANVSLYQRINKAVPKLVLYPYYSNQIYNGSGIPVNLSISSVNNQLFYQLYINSSIVFIDDSNVTYITNASAGVYLIELYSPGNQNYSTIALSTVLTIEKAKPILKLLLNPDKSFYYNGTPLYLEGTIYSFNNQLSADLYINNVLKGKGYSINYSSSAPIKYNIVLETLGNDNYSAAFENFNLTIMNLTSKELLTSKTKLFNQSVLNSVFNVSRLNYKEQIRSFRLFPSYNLSIPLPYNITPVNELSMPVLSNLNGSIFTIYNTKNSSCFGNSLSGVLYSFNDSVNVNEGNFGEVTYLFSLNKNILLNNDLSADNISLYRCSIVNHNWQEIPTFLVNENDTSANYRAVSPGFSQYVIAEGPSLLSAENSSLTVEYIYENGLPAGYRWNATINNVTLQSVSGSPMLTLVPYGQFKIKFYNLSSYASNATYSCELTYIPDIPANSSLLGIAGIPIAVNYSISKVCLSNHEPVVYSLFIEFKYEIITAVILIIALISFMFLYTKRKVRNKKDYKKKLNKRHLNKKVTKKNNHR